MLVLFNLRADDNVVKSCKAVLVKNMAKKEKRIKRKKKGEARACRSVTDSI